MNVEARNDLIDAYFSALDAGDFGLVEPHLAPGFTYVHPATTAEGVEGMRAFFAERPPQDTTHGIDRRLHTEEASVVEGHLSGEMADGTPREGDFCDVFEFDGGDERLTHAEVYPRL